MAKFVCVCGQVLSTSGSIPNPDEWHIVSDEALEPIWESGAVDDVYRISTFVYRCPKSDHLWIYWDGWELPPTLYSPEPAERALAGHDSLFWPKPQDPTGAT